MMKKIALAVLLGLLCLPGMAQDRLTPELLWKIGRVGLDDISPDGKTALYGVTFFDLEQNKGNRNLYTIDLSTDKGVVPKPKRVTDFPGSEFNAVYRPDGKKIGFLSAESGSLQLWEMNPDGSDLKQVSDIPGGIVNFAYAPDGKHISFTQDVKLDKTVNELYPDLPQADARIIDDLMYRHWNQWHDYAYSHLFIAGYDNGKIGEPMDIMKGERFDTPLNPFGGGEQIAWAQDGKSIVYTCKKLNGKEYAVSTNSELYRYDLVSGKTENLTMGMMGYDVEPVFSPDGKSMAWLSMERDGYESDWNRIFIMDLATGKKRQACKSFPHNAGGLHWSKDSKTLYFTSPINATYQAFALDVAKDEVKQLTEGVHNINSVMPYEGGLIGHVNSMSKPADLYRINTKLGHVVPLTNTNAAVLGDVKWGKVEKRMVETTDGKEMLTWVIYPPDFDPNKKYPTLLYCQGGPQSAVSQFFSYRWNFQLMAANGYIVVAPNRRGLPSFGKEWNEQISKDWGGQAMKDYLAAIDAVSEESYVDQDRLGAVGASYGGYSVYYLAGIHEKRFKSFISHCGLYNLESWYGATEEMFFANWDIGGPFWGKNPPASYEKFSPHKLVGNWDTPILVIHGEKDFRVPVGEGMQAFNAAQLQDIPSRFLYFPGEGHWVLSPQNGVLWHRVFFEWLGTTLK